MKRRLPVVATAAAALLAGCGAINSSDKAAAVDIGARWVDGRLRIQVPTPVVLLGFPPADVTRLQAELKPHQVDHSTSDLAQALPPDVEELQEDGPVASAPILGGDPIVLPILPKAAYRVAAAPAAMSSEFAAALGAAKLEGNLYDANAVEDWLATALPRHGFALNPSAPAIVVLHLGAFGVTGHGWRIQGFAGKVEPARVFGERHPLLVLDPSAIPDPYNGGGEDFASPVGTGAAAAIGNFVREATEYRVLQGPIYPVAQAPCHAVTGIVGIHATSLQETGLLVRSAREMLEAARIKASFDHLTGTDVFFDLKILELPVDDPVLDAIGRGEFPAMEALRGYLTLQWEQYHVDHGPQCEEYLSVVFENDLAAVPGGGILGIGTYDDKPGKRISMSWVHDALRLAFDPASPACEPVDASLNTSCAGREYANVFEYLLSHETGHIFGQRHPHDISSASSTSASSDAFSSVWSSMSYEQDGRMIDFGAIDHNNWLRNRAAFALGLAAENGRVGSPEWQAAMAAAGQLDWQGVWLALQPAAN